MASAPTDVRVRSRTRVLVMSAGPISARLAGPAIRSWGIAAALGAECDVTMLTPNHDHPAGDGFVIRCHNNDERLVSAAADVHDVVVIQGMALDLFPGLADTAACLVVDLYDPFTLEALHAQSHRPMAQRVTRNRVDLDILLHQLAVGDFFICAHERQLDYWMGMLTACNRLNPQNSDLDPSFHRLIAVVPYGLPGHTPEPSRHVMKGVLSGIGDSDRVVLWGGGIWDWFDPLTPIRAMALLASTRPEIKLVFLGGGSPDPAVPRMRMPERALQLSKELGVHNTSVFFLDWVPYRDLPNYLLEADLGISTHQDNLEARYSIRTRIFDYMGAELPMILTAGDVVGGWAERAGVATTIPVNDVTQLAAALQRMVDDPQLRAASAAGFAALRAELSWDVVIRPLLEYCRAPSKAADHLDAHAAALARAARNGTLAPAWQLPAKTIDHLRHHGFRGLAGEIRRSLQRRGLRR